MHTWFESNRWRWLLTQPPPPSLRNACEQQGTRRTARPRTRKERRRRKQRRMGARKRRPRRMGMLPRKKGKERQVHRQRRNHCSTFRVWALARAADSLQSHRPSTLASRHLLRGGLRPLPLASGRRLPSPLRLREPVRHLRGEDSRLATAALRPFRALGVPAGAPRRMARRRRMLLEMKRAPRRREAGAGGMVGMTGEVMEARGKIQRRRCLLGKVTASCSWRKWRQPLGRRRSAPCSR